jgi:hypothetical protein
MCLLRVCTLGIWWTNLPGIERWGYYSEFWDNRMEQINNFEKHIVQNSTIVLKFTCIWVESMKPTPEDWRRRNTIGNFRLVIWRNASAGWLYGILWGGDKQDKYKKMRHGMSCLMIKRCVVIITKLFGTKCKNIPI